MNETFIECISLRKEYKAKNKLVTAINDINLEISKGEFVLLKGRSGAGKSTLLYLMSGLINPTSGKVIIGGRCITEMPNDELSQLLLNEVGFIFQNFNLLPTYTIYENLEIAMFPGIHDRKVIRERIMQHAEKFRLLDKLQQKPSDLSVGQQQLVAIVRTLVKQPKLIFADEPTGSVDDETANEILGHLADLNMNNTATIVMATHGNIPSGLAGKVFTLEAGHLKD